MEQVNLGSVIEQAITRSSQNRLGEKPPVEYGKGDNGDSVTLTLWNEDIEKVETNAKVRIVNGWASAYKDKLQVSAGKFGKLEIIS